MTVLLAVAACSGASVGHSEPSQTGADLPPDLAKLGEAYGILLEEHIDHEVLEPEELTDGAIRGLLTALNDPHASYLSAEQHAREQEGYRGFFDGIGARVTLTDAGLTVIAPIPGAPAEAAGILAGDIILAVDGATIDHLTLIEAVNLIRGPSGTDVTLLVRRPNSFEDRSITVTRGRIPIDSTTFRMLDGGIGHLWVYSFSDTTEGEVRAALDELDDAGGRGLVLDLRNNPGGLLAAVLDVSDLFLDGGSILYEIDAQGQRTDHEASRGGDANSIPMTVLINQYSASASEILAGAIKANERATVIGETTFGKGSVNITRELSDGSAIYFSIRRWYLPDGTQIEGQGVTPNVEIASDAQTLPVPLNDDIALRKAIEILEQQLGSR
ncbi:MAG: S41 family peptidase [Chloroflexi bacterium]|nr:S41 family peptidase [Chloroflexota bacterium]